MIMQYKKRIVYIITLTAAAVLLIISLYTQKRSNNSTQNNLTQSGIQGISHIVAEHNNASSSNNSNPELNFTLSDNKRILKRDGIIGYDLKIDRNETLYSKLMEVGFSNSAAHLISHSINDKYTLSRLQYNQHVLITMPMDNNFMAHDEIGKIKAISALNVLIRDKLIEVEFFEKNKLYQSSVSANRSTEDAYATLENKNIHKLIENAANTNHGNIIMQNDKHKQYIAPNSMHNQTTQSIHTAEHELVANLYTSDIVIPEKFANIRIINEPIINSLLYTLQSNDVPRNIAYNIVNVLKGTINLKRDITIGSTITALYQPGSGNIHEDKILYIKLYTPNTGEIELYRYEMPNKDVRFHYKNGGNIAKLLLGSPIEGAKIVSPFGMRYHPKLKRLRMHKGVDYRAKKGTPIMSTGDGVVEIVTHHKHYGRYVKIKHNNTYSTLYAHLDSFSPNIKKGQRVQQGQIIGNSGATGLATGPHLHYELHKNGVQINPLQAEKSLITSDPLSRKDKLLFNTQRDEINQLLHSMIENDAVSKHQVYNIIEATV